MTKYVLAICPVCQLEATAVLDPTQDEEGCLSIESRYSLCSHQNSTGHYCDGQGMSPQAIVNHHSQGVSCV